MLQHNATARCSSTMVQHDATAPTQCCNTAGARHFDEVRYVHPSRQTQSRAPRGLPGSYQPEPVCTASAQTETSSQPPRTTTPLPNHHNDTHHMPAHHNSTATYTGDTKTRHPRRQTHSTPQKRTTTGTGGGNSFRRQHTRALGDLEARHQRRQTHSTSQKRTTTGTGRGQQLPSAAHTHVRLATLALAEICAASFLLTASGCAQPSSPNDSELAPVTAGPPRLPRLPPRCACFCCLPPPFPAPPRPGVSGRNDGVPDRLRLWDRDRLRDLLRLQLRLRLELYLLERLPRYRRSRLPDRLRLRLRL